jgi:hypothetical protein
LTSKPFSFLDQTKTCLGKNPFSMVSVTAYVTHEGFLCRYFCSQIFSALAVQTCVIVNEATGLPDFSWYNIPKRKNKPKSDK